MRKCASIHIQHSTQVFGLTRACHKASRWVQPFAGLTVVTNSQTDHTTLFKRPKS